MLDLRPEERQDFSALLRKIWRHRLLLLLCVIVGGAIASAVAAAMPRHYVAEARLMVDVPRPRIFRTANDPSFPDLPNNDLNRAQNEAYVLQSRGLAARVLSQLDLADNPNFNLNVATSGAWGAAFDLLPQGWRSTVEHALLPSAPSETPARRDQRLIDQFVTDTVNVNPLGRSNVLSIQADTTDPELSASIANTLAGAYLDQQRSHQIDATNRVTKYVDDRIAELRQQVQQSEQAVEDYRRQNGLYRSGANDITAQRLGEINSQLVQAQAAKEDADAKLNEAIAMRAKGGAQDSVPDVLQSQLVQSLKTQRATVARNLAQLKASYGPNYPKVLDAQAELNEIDRKVNAEIGHAVEGLRHQAMAADARYAALMKDFSGAKTQMGGVNDKAIHLEALEREATIERKLLEDMLSRAKQTIGRPAAEQVDAELISPAAPPLYPTYPPRTLIAFLGLIVGACGGVMASLLRDSSDHTFRRAEQIESMTGLPVMALVPNLGAGKSPAMAVLRDPLSPYGEALRRLYIMLAMSEAARPPRTVLFGSAVPGEGKSVSVVSMCRLVAGSGKRVLLIDCDWRSPTSHRLLQRSNQRGLEALLTEPHLDPRDVVVSDVHTGLDLIPAGNWNSNAAHLLASKRMQEIVEAVSAQYDLVVLDSPPVLVGAEVLPLASFVDKVVFVVRWGETPRDDVMNAIKQLTEARSDFAGIVLSRVNPKRYGTYAYATANFTYGTTVVTRLG